MRNPAFRGGEDGYASKTPLADLHMELVALNREQLVLEQHQLALEQRQQKLMGVYQDILWRLEPSIKQTAPGTTSAA